MKQWNHDQRRDGVLLEKNARNSQINVNYKRKEQNNAKQWIQQRTKDLLSKQAEINYFNVNCADVTIYSLCYSLIKSCSYCGIQKHTL